MRLKKCVAGEVKNTETLNDINHLLREGGFMNCTAKYLDGQRVFTKCSSTAVMEAILTEGSKSLLEWFE